MIRPLLLVSALVAATLACSCRPGVPNKEKFCNSDVVGVFKIIQKFPDPNKNNTGGFVHYTQTTHVFKQQNGQPNVPEIAIIRTPQGAACGVDWLQEGKEYLLNGGFLFENYPPGVLDIFSCNQLQGSQWDSVNPEIKSALENKTYLPCP
ncbi:hypothetical protein L596_028525 [Steinernema carpocapsae]|uniref:NTR domain-containing protein n=1 Tax=Steinernema carpocapsae TaxID=34508 RepID=A0A4U5LYQ0_STECR|nr:hypothetical protein L596_028525 [Steinernema carpocapsae]